MTESNHLIHRTEALVRQRLAGEATGHDWYHTDRVRYLALRIAADEQIAGAEVNRLTVELAALLHDIEDWKFHKGDDSVGPRAAAAWLGEQGVDPDLIDHVAEIIATMSFKGAGVSTPMRTIEGQIVQDADRLEALGAIGIARSFAYGGFKGQMIHDPEITPAMHESFEAYKTAGGTTINHFSEKLLLLRDRMNTETGRRIAAHRHQFMESFLAEFFAEWEGKA